jgi:hypothetical protein
MDTDTGIGRSWLQRKGHGEVESWCRDKRDGQSGCQVSDGIVTGVNAFRIAADERAHRHEMTGTADRRNVLFVSSRHPATSHETSMVVSSNTPALSTPSQLLYAPSIPFTDSPYHRPMTSGFFTSFHYIPTWLFHMIMPQEVQV